MKIFHFIVCAFICSIPQWAWTQNCSPATAQHLLEGGNLRANILNGGDLFWDLSDAQFEVPIEESNGAKTVFAGAIWLGGLDDGGNLKVAAQTYRQTGNDFFPGPILDDGSTICEDMDYVWSVNGYEIQGLKSDFADNGMIDNTIATNILSCLQKGILIFSIKWVSHYPIKI